MIEGLSQRTPKRLTDATENQVQRSIIKYMRATRALKLGWTFHSIPNGGKGRNQINANLMGELSGAGDLAIIGPDQRIHYMEVKTQSGLLGPYQEDFQRHCARVGLDYEVARNLDDAILILNAWGFPSLAKTV